MVQQAASWIAQSAPSHNVPLLSPAGDAHPQPVADLPYFGHEAMELLQGQKKDCRVWA